MDKLIDLLAGQPLALVVFAVVLALIVAVRYLGLWQGQNSSAAESATAAQVAAVIVDPTALMANTAAIEAANIVQTEANMIAKTNSVAVDRLGKGLEDLAEGVDKLRDELLRISAKMH